MKKTKDQMEKQMKTETEKFTKIKQKVVKELHHAKKVASDKDKAVFKLK